MLSRRYARLRPWRRASPLSIIVEIPVRDGHFRVDSSRRGSVHPREGAQGDAQASSDEPVPRRREAPALSVGQPVPRGLV